MKNTERIPIRYLPYRLTRKDKDKQVKMLNKSKRLYKQGIFYTRKKLPSYHSKTSKHVKNAQEI